MGGGDHGYRYAGGNCKARGRAYVSFQVWAADARLSLTVVLLVYMPLLLSVVPLAHSALALLWWRLQAHASFSLAVNPRPASPHLREGANGLGLVYCPRKRLCLPSATSSSPTFPLIGHISLPPPPSPPSPQYLELVKELITSGTFRPDRTGTGTYSRLGRVTRWNLRHTFPLLTSKRVFWKGEEPPGGKGVALCCGAAAGRGVGPAR